LVWWAWGIFMKQAALLDASEIWLKQCRAKAAAAEAGGSVRVALSSNRAAHCSLQEAEVSWIYRLRLQAVPPPLPPLTISCGSPS
jgi:hypothetical protein